LSSKTIPSSSKDFLILSANSKSFLVLAFALFSISSKICLFVSFLIDISSSLDEFVLNQLSEVFSSNPKICDEFLKCNDLIHFEELIQEHESIISKAISINPIQKSTFIGYKDGKIKSLGSWGGDFILVTTKNKDLTYFRNRGLNTIIPLKEMVYLG